MLSGFPIKVSAFLGLSSWLLSSDAFRISKTRVSDFTHASDKEPKNQSWKHSCPADMDNTEIARVVDAKGQVVVVTGASGAAGYQISKAVVIAKATVVMVCRTRSKCEDGKRRVLEDVDDASETQIHIVEFDMSMDGVAAGAEEIKKRFDYVSVLVHNAGLRGPDSLLPTISKSGFQKTMEVNHFAPALLTELMLPLLEKSSESGTPARVVNVASFSAFEASYPKEFFGASVDDLMQFSRQPLKSPTNVGKNGQWQYYHLSKFLQIEHAQEFARRHGPTVVAFSVNPGYFRDAPTRMDMQICATNLPDFKPCPQTSAQGATGIVFAALMPDIESASGAMIDYETDIKDFSQTGSSCISRPIPTSWTQHDAANWYDMMQAAIESWK